MTDPVPTETVNKYKPVIIRFPTNEGHCEVPGWIAPDTDGLFAVDMRIEADVETLSPADWRITHLPSGFAANNGHYTESAFRHEAFAIAKRLYQELLKLGVDLKSTDPAAVIAPYKRLSEEEATAFWMGVAGWNQEVEVIKQ